MKRTILLLLLLILPLMSAIEIDMKSEFNQGETLMAKFSGNFLEPLEKENIFFYREHVKIPLEYDIAKIDNEYYIYALLGDKTPNNYSLSIENTRYMQGTTVSEEDIVKTFIITEDLVDFSIDPGFIITDESFTIKVQNLRDFKIEIDINENKTKTGGTLFENLFGGGLTKSDNSIELFSGEIKDLEFDLGNETSFRFVKLSTENITYEIPVYVFVIEITEEQEEDEEETTSEEGEESETTSEEGEESETPGEEDEEEEKEIRIASTKTCIELEGIVCGDKEKCNGTIAYADAVCCIGNCEEIEKDNTGKILGWSMVIIIVVFVIWFFKTKYKRAKKEINLLKIAKGKK